MQKYYVVIFLDLYVYIYVLIWVEFLFCENDVLAESGAARSVQTLPAPRGLLSIGAWQPGLSSGLAGHGSRPVTAWVCVSGGVLGPLIHTGSPSAEMSSPENHP